MDITSKKTLVNGVELPVLGLGVYQSPAGETTVSSIRWAVEAGYRHIDAASVYGNEESVGEGIRTCGIPREELFLTSKLWNDDIRKGRVKEAFQESLTRLGVDYLDLYLIHWPADGYEQAWKVLEELYQEGRVRAIGVSNFHKSHIEALAAQAKVMPMVNQFECHPYLAQNELIALCNQYSMVYESYSPLSGQGGPILSDPVVQAIAASRNRTAAQIVLRWHLQRGSVVLPKSNHQDRLRSNMQIFDFSLSESETAQMNSLNRGLRTGGDPDNFDF